MARPSTAWKPGQSGNPGGRPKQLADVMELARSHTTAAVTTLFEIMQAAKKPPAARVAAAQALLDRGWGKPAQTMHGHLALEQLPQGIDAPPQSPETREQWLARRRKELEAVVSTATAVKAAADATKH